MARRLGRAKCRLAGPRILAPASLVVVVTGIAVTINGDLDWGQFWLVFGLVAWGTSAAIGIVYLTPKIKRLAAIVTERGPTDPEGVAPACSPAGGED